VLDDAEVVAVGKLEDHFRASDTVIGDGAEGLTSEHSM
jgi:hypothetical protein